MLTNKELTSWLNSYDYKKYPTKLYEELVCQQKNHPKRFTLLGAWKTGCLKINQK